MRVSTLAKWTFGASLVAMVVLWIAMVATPLSMMRSGEMLIALAAMTAGCALSVYCCAFTMERGRARLMMCSGIAASLAAFGLWIAAYWVNQMGANIVGDFVIGVAGTVTVVAGFCVVAALVVRYRVSLVLSIALRIPTLIVAAILSIGIISAIWAYDSLWGRGWAFESRFLPTFILLTVFGVLTTLIMARMRELVGDREDVEHDSPRIGFTLWCPRCETRQAFETGGGTCCRCGLLIRVLIP